MGLELLIGGTVLLIVILALANPRLWRDLKSGHDSMNDVLKEGREDLKTAFRSRKNKNDPKP